MFHIEDIDPKVYRTRSRNATLVMMAIFIVIGFVLAQLSLHYLGPYNDNKIVLNLMGGVAGLIVTGFIVKAFLADKPFMKETMYAFRLKRNLMYVTNKLRPIKEAAEAGDTNAMKCLRFYHIGLTQMHKFDNNTTALIDLDAEIRLLLDKMNELELDTQQTSFDPEWVKDYANDEQD